MTTEYVTKRCSHFGAREFRFSVDDSQVMRTDVNWFLQTLEDRVAVGERFASDETIQVGWGLLKVRANADNSLQLLEPNYTSMPIEWVDSVTKTIAHLRLQKDVVESYFEPDDAEFPSLRHHSLVCSKLQDAERLLMDRTAATVPDSGWFIGCSVANHNHNDPGELECVSLYEAVLRNPRALMFLALPAGTVLETEGRTWQLYHGEVELRPKGGSFGEHIIKSRGR
jgi:hypothetical protein